MEPELEGRREGGSGTRGAIVGQKQHVSGEAGSDGKTIAEVVVEASTEAKVDPPDTLRVGQSCHLRITTPHYCIEPELAQGDPESAFAKQRPRRKISHGGHTKTCAQREIEDTHSELSAVNQP